MGLDKEKLKDDIFNLLTELRTREEASIDEFASGLSDLIDEYVRSANIKYLTGLTAGGNAVVGSFNGGLE